MHRVLYLVQKEFRQILREKAFIGIIFVMPFIQIVVLGFAITTDVKNVTLGVVDYDKSSASRRIIDAFDKTSSFIYMYNLESEKAAQKKLDEGLIKVAIIVPENFERDLRSAHAPVVQALIDGVDGNSAGVATAYVSQIARKLQIEWLQDAGVAPQVLSKMHLTQIEPRMLYNASLESKNNIIPGIIAVLLTMITAFLTGMSIVREKEIGTLEQLMVTPIKNYELILGKIIPFIIVAFLLMLVGILAGGLIFGIWVKGSIVLLFALSILFSLSTLGLGIFASTVSKTQQQAMFIAWFFAIFAILLSGFFIPIQNMPDWVQVVTYLNPLRYFIVIIREIYLKGTPLVYLLNETLAMGIFGLVTFTLASLRFHKRLS
ncbi:MAG: ABC transporter permease [Calditrichaeota bacterium]|nr:ABC transporter permease [Calditrichota bacterium]